MLGDHIEKWKKNKNNSYQGDVSFGIVENRLNFSFLLPVNENESRFWAINYMAANDKIKCAIIKMKIKTRRLTMNKL